MKGTATKDLPKNIHLRVSEKMHEWLMARAREQESDMGAAIRSVVRDAMKAEEK